MILRQRHVCTVLGFSSTRLHILRNENKLPASGKDKHGYFWTETDVLSYITATEGGNEDYATEARQRLSVIMEDADNHRRPGRPISVEVT